MRKVLLTGITGFLGSHIAERLLADNVIIIGLKRANSDTWRCTSFYSQIDWVNIDDGNHFIETIIAKNIDTIIHGAWIGVNAAERNDWNEQIKNIFLLTQLIDIAKKSKLSKFVMLGSQSEYGVLNNIADETQMSNADNAYAGTKLACLEILKTFCNSYQITWIWARIFSIFGEKEDNTWLIPSTISKMMSKAEMDFSPADQRYAYLYVKDFSNIIFALTLKTVESGIYNVSSEASLQLRQLIEKIRQNVNINFKLNFGALQYRENQSSHIQGDISKLRGQIGDIQFTNFEVALENTVNYYLKK